jgi:beta-barrel assembly-enhancing protease
LSDTTELRPRGRRAWMVAGIVAAILLVCGPALYFVLPAVPGKLAAMVPIAWEEQIGDLTLHSIPGRRCGAADGQAALDALTRRVLGDSAMPYHLQVTVRDSDIINAFALPGGRIVILRGLLRSAQSPEEVAGVLAHELTHVLKRHPTRNMIAQQGTSLILGAFTGGGIGHIVGTLLVSLSYTRAAEEEADAGAMELLDRAGISSWGLLSFFERLLQDEEKSGESQWLSLVFPNYLRTHPATQQRIATVRAQAGPGTQPALNPRQWLALRTICDVEKK